MSNGQSAIGNEYAHDEYGAGHPLPIAHCPLPIEN